MSILARQAARRAILVLADGTVFHGTAIGASGKAVGEVVFNTAMTGYQEILTDPSYSEQIVTLTYPHIGNYGTNSEDTESDKVWAKALVIRDLPLLASNFRSQQSLDEYLKSHNVVGIADIDTRRLTNVLRNKGAQNGCIIAFGADADVTTSDSEQTALAAAQAFPGLQGMDLAKLASCTAPHSWTQTSWQLESGYGEQTQSQFHVVAYDYGVKHNILRMLADRGCRITVVPAQTSAADVLALQPDGIFLSNGPGDPAACDYAIEAIRELLEHNIPIFGICLGHQLLALAMGARTTKMPHGHHGANHPVLDIAKGVVMITSQNHGFAVDEKSLPSHLQATHRSLFDQTLQGIHATDKPAFGFQGHPEASPGPHDAAPLFEHFIDLMKTHQANQ
ncbi:glutamine-hydrolyzing carbamoyl-phosphate synthase small subunit [Aliidiomarina maris]|uniref:Carbamoyl phosphate synthase small chain n=1 Tax=Aliidiomarina maris TaxID=531312 RepID=A0A327WVE6_9GAMM|nr:glutamine-hydrolyzing carbamoyl-phosphate synthase small subunit [Aliidiomarina maris]RAJ96853.1 carbamoyl-phosphate synthase small subunit [Aliidiomarina maris]RUO24207.1 carbamoyl-phosphate synthase small subunit [Aliidiomarina maris]